MPATSKKQKTFMDAVAHNPAFAKKVGVPKAVGKDFSEASKGMKFGKGSTTRADRQTINNPKTNQGKQELFKEGGSMATKMNPGFMAMMAKKKAGSGKMAAFEKSGKDVEMKGVKEGSPKDRAMDKKQMAMKKGGMAGGGMPMKDGKPAFIGDGKGAMKKGGMASGMHKMPDGKMMKDSAMKKINMGGMAKGGSVSARADGVATKGKTKGKMLAKGGKAYC